MTPAICNQCDQPITPDQTDAAHSNDGRPCHENCCPCWLAERLGASRMHVYDNHRAAVAAELERWAL